MSVLDKFGVSAGDLADHSARVNYPKPVAGRVVHIDADFMAYQVSAESKKELDPNDRTPRKSLADMQHNAEVAVEHIMRLAGGTDFHVHTTPSGSNKGGRHAQAVTKEYQANRKSTADKPEFLDVIRAYIVTTIGANGRGTAHLDQEADDGMATAAWAAYNAGTPELVVVASMDKDLRMCPGPQLIKDKVTTFDGTFGSIWIDTNTTAKKCVGRGTKFFWAQLLMGDTADHIGGLPEVTGAHCMAVAPTQAFNKLMDRYVLAESNEPELVRVNRGLDALLAKRKKCGAVLTEALLRDHHTDQACFKYVRGLWVDLEADGYVFRHWETGEQVTATQALLGDMRTLWMRRNKNPDDVMTWIKETMT